MTEPPRMIQTPAGLAEPWQVGEETDAEHAAANLAARLQTIANSLGRKDADTLDEAAAALITQAARITSLEQDLEEMSRAEDHG